jgi:predicted DNA binding CopG/RHH family protein
MLHLMPQAGPDSSLPTAPDFAGLLAALTSPSPKPKPGWNDEDLADDVATLSYEQALHTHTRYKAVDTNDGALTQVVDSERMRKLTRRDSAFTAASPATPQTREWANDAHRKSAADPSTAIEEDRKRASITIRMSQLECEQLKSRAAEAGLSMSAYLRSCTFEAEALRAQVKEALADLRKANAAVNQAAPDKIRSSRFAWLRWLTRQRNSSVSAART